MINIENQYRGLVAAILQSAPNKEDRTGVGTKSVVSTRYDYGLSSFN